MAKAVYNPYVSCVPAREEIKAKPATVTLTLSEEEAAYLYRLTGNNVLGGGNQRGINDDIYNVLDNVIGFSDCLPLACTELNSNIVLV